MFGEQLAAIKAALNFLAGILHFKSLEEDGVCHTCGTLIPKGVKAFVIVPVDEHNREGEEVPFCTTTCRGKHAEACSALVEGQAA